MFECHLKFVGEDETVYWPGKNEMLSITLIAVRYRDNSVLTSSVSVTKKYHTEPFSLHCCRRQQKHVDPQCNSAIKKKFKKSEYGLETSNGDDDELMLNVLRCQLTY